MLFFFTDKSLIATSINLFDSVNRLRGVAYEAETLLIATRLILHGQPVRYYINVAATITHVSLAFNAKRYFAVLYRVTIISSHC